MELHADLPEAIVADLRAEIVRKGRLVGFGADGAAGCVGSSMPALVRAPDGLAQLVVDTLAVLHRFHRAINHVGVGFSNGVMVMAQTHGAAGVVLRLVDNTTSRDGVQQLAVFNVTAWPESAVVGRDAPAYLSDLVWANSHHEWWTKGVNLTLDHQARCGDGVSIAREPA